MAQHFYIFDYCRRRQLTAVSRTVELQSPFDTNEPSVVAGASLGCNVPVSHLPTSVGLVVSRINHNTGEPIIGFVPSADSEILNNPGQTAWLYGIDTPLIEGTVSQSFPVSQIARNYVVTVNGINWMQDVVPGTGIAPNPGIPSMSRVEFGGNLGIKRTCIVANDQEFDVGNRIKALHRHKHYAQIATVGNDVLPLSLLATSGGSPWRWPGAFSPSSVKQAGGFAASLPNFAWDLRIRFWGVNPAKIGHGSITYDDQQVNAGLDRKYSFLPIDDVTAPDFGGSISGGLGITNRSAVHLYGSFINAGTDPGNIRLLLNGTDVTDNFSAASLPTPQFSGSTFLFPNETYDQLMTMSAMNIFEWEVAVSSSHHAALGFPEPFPLGTIVFGSSALDGFFYEGTVRFLRSNSLPP